MAKDAEEWLRQAEYDLDTADAMHATGGNFYAIRMCHLAIEKALKGLYQASQKEIPPKIHNRIYFIEKLNISFPKKLEDFVETLNDLSVPTRYPETISKMLKEFPLSKVKQFILQSKEVFQWIKKRYEKL